MAAEEKPQQMLKAEFQLAETVCAGPREAANYMVGLGELWALFESLGESKTNVVEAAQSSQLRFQRQKQDFGCYSAEFLQMCFNESVWRPFVQ